MPDDIDEAVTGDEVKNKGKKDKKDRGYKMFEEEDSGEELVADNKSKSEQKQKKIKPSFKFPKKESKRDNKEPKYKDKKEKYINSKEIIKEPKQEKELKEKKFKDKKDKKSDKEEAKKDEDLSVQNSASKPKWKRKFIVKAPIEDASNVTTTEDKAIFGLPLQIAIDRCPGHDGIPLPVIVRLCIDYISEYGMACEGIYRISGVKSKVEQLKEAFNNNMHHSVNLIDYEPNVVAGLLKQYLRELPEPVLTNKLGALFEQASAIKNIKEKVEKLIFLIEQLPLANRTLLSWIIIHMTQIIAKEKQNKMSLQNVSIVLSPTLQISHRVLNALFTYSRILFKDTIIKRYVPPLKPATSRWILELPEGQDELENELQKQESLLGHLHEELTRVKDEKKEEQLWEVQRIVTQLKRKLKLVKQVESEAHPKTFLSSAHKHTKSEGMQAGTPLSTRSDFHRHSKSPRSSKKSDKSSFGDKSSVCGDDQIKASCIKDEVDKVSVTDGNVLNNVDVVSSNVSSQDNADGMKINDEISEFKSSPVLNKSSADNIVPQESEKISSENERTLDKSDIDKLNDPNLVKNLSSTKLNKKSRSGLKLENIQTCVDKTADTENKMLPEAQADTAGQQQQVTTESFPSNKVAGLERKNSELSLGTDNSSLEAATSSISRDGGSFGNSPFGGIGASAYLGDEETDSSDDYTDVCSNDDDYDQGIEDSQNDRLKPKIAGTYEKLVGDESPSSASFGILQALKPFNNQIGTNDMTGSDSSATSDFESEDNAREFEKLLKEHTYLMMEEEELLALGDELRQKIATERNETDRLEQDIAEVQFMREQDAFDSTSMTSSSSSMTSSSSSADEEDDEKLLEELMQLKEENDNLEHANTELCEKIHEERMICLGVKINIRMLQQKQIETADLLTDQESLI